MPFTRLNYRGRGNSEFPQGLVVQGPTIPVEISIPSALATQFQQDGKVPPTPITGYALIDTGASISSIDDSVANKLELKPVGVHTMGTAGGPVPTNAYLANISFPGTQVGNIDGEFLGVNLTGQGVFATAQVAGTNVAVARAANTQLVALIGRDVLMNFVMIYDGPAGRVILAL